MRKISFMLAVMAAISAGANAYWNELRASTGCGQDYSWVFRSEKGLVLALETAWPMAAFAFISFALGISQFIKKATLVAASLLLVICGYSFIDDCLRSYAPCDRNGDETSLFLMISTFAIAMLWLMSILPEMLRPQAEDGKAEHGDTVGKEESSN